MSAPCVGPFYTAQARVQAHKKYVIWLTGSSPDQISDASHKDLFDLRSQLAERPRSSLHPVEMAACREMTNSAPSRTVHFGPKSRKKNRIHGPACERGLRRATTPPVRLPGSGPDQWLMLLLLCLNETARLEVSPQPDNRHQPTSLGLLRRAHPRKERC
jgi:hypothetical protein